MPVPTERTDTATLGLPAGHRSLVAARPDEQAGTMTKTRDAWAAVASDLDALAIKLKMHYEQAASADAEAAREALGRLRSAIDDTVDAFGHAAKDIAVREDLDRVRTSIVDAFTKTFDGISAEFSDAFKR